MIGENVRSNATVITVVNVGRNPNVASMIFRHESDIQTLITAENIARDESRYRLGDLDIKSVEGPVQELRQFPPGEVMTDAAMQPRSKRK